LRDRVAVRSIAAQTPPNRASRKRSLILYRTYSPGHVVSGNRMSRSPFARTCVPVLRSTQVTAGAACGSRARAEVRRRDAARREGPS
jgi:hypothetical protein